MIKIINSEVSILKNNPSHESFGLPKKVLFCKKCVISNQRPNSAIEYKNKANSKKTTINFDTQGVCDACNFALHKKKINWNDRERELLDLCDQYRRTDGRYDCLVPGSGGKDSFFTSYLLKYKYKMNPLTVTWAPHMYTKWGWNNFQKWIHSGFDNILVTPNGKVHRLLTRLALENLLHPFQPFMLGQKNIAPKIALNNDIKLIFYGENEAEYGNPIKNNKSSEFGKDFFSSDDLSSIFLSGESVKNLKKKYRFSDFDLKPYIPESKSLVEEKKINYKYLGYFIKWHPQECYYFAVENGGFEASPERTCGTYSKYNSIDDKLDDLHYFTLFIKFGIGRATYDCSQEIRNEEITREEGVSLVKQYDGEYPERFMNEIINYLDVSDLDKYFDVKKIPLMTRKHLDVLCDKFRSPHLWQKVDNKWALKKTVWK